MDPFPLMPICTNWLSKIHKAQEYKQRVFGKFAEEAMRFFDGPYDWIYERPGWSASEGGGVGMSVDDDVNIAPPAFRMSVNKVSEMVQLFGPVLYHKNPHRMVTPKEDLTFTPEEVGVADQQAFAIYQMSGQATAQANTASKVRAKILEAYLNAIPEETDLKDHARMATDEAIIKGMGVLWTEIELLANGTRIVGSFYDSIDNLVVDPDADVFEKCWWVAHRCAEPIWKVERDYGLKSGSLRGTGESWNSVHESDPDKTKSYWRQKGETADLITYWKVWSRMGMGGRLSGMAAHPGARNIVDGISDVLSTYGENCFLALADNIPYPLNLPPEVTQSADDAEVTRRVQWPIPFWADKTWPFTEFSFHKAPRQSWPVSHLKPAVGYLKFLNWAYSFLAGKIRTTCRDFIFIKKSANEETKKALERGSDLTIVELDEIQGKIDEIVKFMQHPPMSKDIWDVIEAVANEFEKAVGLNDLAYGMTDTQSRSATDTEIKQGNLRIRPDDMASKIEEAMTEVAKKEAIAARTVLTPQDVLPIIGPQAAFYWGRYVMTGSFEEIVHQLSYRIEAGSTRKPNRERFAQNMGQALQTLFQPLLNFGMQTGQLQPINNLIADWAKSIDLDASGYLFQLPPPMPAAPVQGGAPGQPPPMAPGMGPGMMPPPPQ